MSVVGIDTAARVGGVAVVRSGEFLGAEILGVREGHSENLLPALERLLAALSIERTAIQGIAVSIGPGSFTGLRIGLSAAKAMAYAWSVPLVGVSTLVATAWAYRGLDAVICAALDARRESVFRGLYDGAALQSAGDERRIEVSAVTEELRHMLEKGRSVVLVGDGAPMIGEALRNHVAEDAPALWTKVAVAPLGAEVQRPAHVACIGEIEMKKGRRDDPFALVPNYLRRSEAERRWKQLKPQS